MQFVAEDVKDTHFGGFLKKKKTFGDGTGDGMVTGRMFCDAYSYYI